MKRKQNSFLWYGLVLLVMLSMIVAIEFVSVNDKLTLIKEGGPIERLTAAGYFSCLLLFLCQGRKKLEPISFLLMSMFILLLSLRELDFYDRFTTMEIFKIGFYISPTVSLTEKLTGAVVTILFLYTIIFLITRHGKDFLSALVNNEFWSIGIFLGLTLMVVSKFIGSQAGFVEQVMATFGVAWKPIALSVEEILELYIPVMYSLN